MLQSALLPRGESIAIAEPTIATLPKWLLQVEQAIATLLRLVTTGRSSIATLPNDCYEVEQAIATSLRLVATDRSSIATFLKWLR